jgi:hypothetical protein
MILKAGYLWTRFHWGCSKTKFGLSGVQITSENKFRARVWPGEIPKFRPVHIPKLPSPLICKKIMKREEMCV